MDANGVDQMFDAMDNVRWAREEREERERQANRAFPYKVTVDDAPKGGYEWTVWHWRGGCYAVNVAGYSPSVTGAYRDGWQCVMTLEATNA